MVDDAPGSEPLALIIAPEPTDWLPPMLDELQALGPVEVFAPWVLPPTLARLGRRVGFVRRRTGEQLPGARGHGWFTAAELLLRGFARGKTAATLSNRVRMRALADHAAGFRVARGPAPRFLVAPSLAARRCFAQGRRAGSTCVLVEDMPDLDSLVDGLDSLAATLPQATFLRNHRPQPQAHARQRAERWQADVIGIRGRVAWSRLGSRKPRVQLPRAVSSRPGLPGRDVLFAGPPLARCGSAELPALLHALPGLTIRVLPGPCSEPASLAQHPRLKVHRGSDLTGIGAVLSLSPLESHPVPVARALDAGIPIVGTRASTGLIAPASMVCIDDPTPRALADALATALSAHAPVPQPWLAPQSLAQYVVASSRTIETDSAASPSVRTSVPTT